MIKKINCPNPSFEQIQKFSNNFKKTVLFLGTDLSSLNVEEDFSYEKLNDYLDKQPSVVSKTRLHVPSYWDDNPLSK